MKYIFNSEVKSVMEKLPKNKLWDFEDRVCNLYPKVEQVDRFGVEFIDCDPANFDAFQEIQKTILKAKKKKSRSYPISYHQYAMSKKYPNISRFNIVIRNFEDELAFVKAKIAKYYGKEVEPYEFVTKDKMTVNATEFSFYTEVSNA